MAFGLLNVAGKVYPGGTPQDAVATQPESVCAQTLPAWGSAGLTRRRTLPTSDFTDTLGALIFRPLADFNLVGLAFICRHASAIASKSATARVWFVREAPAIEGRTIGDGDYFEYKVEPIGDITIATSATPPIVSATDSVIGGAQTAYADSITFVPYIDSVRWRVEGNAPAVSSTLKIDYHGVRGFIIAINVGTMTGIRVESHGI
jgi:hypothetical protein